MAVRGRPTAEPRLRAPEAAIRTVTPPPAPTQLPLDPHGFVGRTEYLKRLDALLPEYRIPTTVITGTAGIGKTALAVRWAHRVRDHFPDGRFYVNLLGFDPGRTPLTPSDALRTLLYALHVPPHQVPATLEGRAAQYRGLLAGQRILIVLDNAADAEQVRPMLHSNPGSMVLVTSRNPLTGLVIVDGAHSMHLDPLSTSEAAEILTHRLHPGSVAADRAAVDQIIDTCDRLPLALTIAASRATTDPGLTVTALAGELRRTRDDVDAFDHADGSAQVRAVVACTYRSLAPETARLFRLLGTHPGPDTTAPAAAALAGVPLPKAHLLLAELTRTRLLAEHTPGRYVFHDLLRGYAADLAHRDEPAGARRDALHRLLDHYLHTAYRAARLLEPHRDPIALAEPQDEPLATALDDQDRAMHWLDAEFATVLALVPHAARAGFGAHAWQLAWSFTTYSNRRGHWAELVTALRDVVLLVDPLGEAHVHRLLGLATAHIGRNDDADVHLNRALALAEQAGNPLLQVNVHHNLAWLCQRNGEFQDGLAHAQNAEHLCRELGHLPGQARMLNGVGWFHALLGNHEEAIVRCRQALELLEELGDRPSQANTLDTLGYAHHHLGRYDEAAECFERALTLFRHDADRFHEADTLTHLGDTWDAAGDPAGANTAWNEALIILTELGHADAAVLRRKLGGG